MTNIMIIHFSASNWYKRRRSFQPNCWEYVPKCLYLYMMKKNALICGFFFFAGLLQAQDAIPHPVRSSDKERAAKLVSQMTLDEKIRLISGDKENSFWTAGIPRLGIPAIQTADGPQGIRRKTKSTLYPSGIATAASWNKDLARSIGEGIAQDAKARGAAILLGPGTNIYRSALCGRNFEYYGEDRTYQLPCPRRRHFPSVGAPYYR